MPPVWPTCRESAVSSGHRAPGVCTRRRRLDGCPARLETAAAYMAPKEYKNVEEEIPALVQPRLELGCTPPTKQLQKRMTPLVFGKLMDITARHLIIKSFEKRTWSYGRRTNADGVLRIERDFTGIISMTTRGDYGTRKAAADIDGC
ncbi:hypothetical protein F5X97DRAFT_319358 [Nemania serpens]|nr:hypothetical protein F5X97DRAFT_319358 [Nemania serpens]